MADIYRQEHIGETAEHIHTMHDWHKRVAPWQAPYTPETRRERYMPGTGEPIETPKHDGQ